MAGKEVIELFLTFLKVGAFTLGGGYAMVPIMEREVVDKHEWLSREDFLNILAVSQAMPGLFAMNMASHIGHKRFGVWGGVVGTMGVAFPSIVAILLIAMFFQQFKENIYVEKAFRGIRPAVVALIAGPVFTMARSARITLRTLWIPVVACLLIWALGVSPIYVILAAGVGGYLYGRIHPTTSSQSLPTAHSQGRGEANPQNKKLHSSILPLFLLGLPLLARGAGGGLVLFLRLFLTFSKIGIFNFGGGYAMLSLIQNEVVEKQHWLSNAEFTDIVAISQGTPGPIGINCATYVGYTAVINDGMPQWAGVLGAILASLSVIWLPFLLMLLVSRFLLKHHDSKPVRDVFSGLRPAIVGLIAAASLLLMTSDNFSSPSESPFAFIVSIAIFLLAFVGTRLYKIHPILMIVLCGLAGLIIY